MRLWTIHPRYLDARGLVAVWREGLLAQKVLQGNTRGYKHHPQLIRFQKQRQPVHSIAAFLLEIVEEAGRRGYRFDASKIAGPQNGGKIAETRGQLQYEWKHLLSKLRRRSPRDYRRLRQVKRPRAHPLFRLVPGGVRDWERG